MAREFLIRSKGQTMLRFLVFDIPSLDKQATKGQGSGFLSRTVIYVQIAVITNVLAYTVLS